MKLREVYGHMGEDNFSYDCLIQDATSPVKEKKTVDTDGHTVAVLQGSKQRFAEPVSESDILRKIKGAIPVSTRITTLVFLPWN